MGNADEGTPKCYTKMTPQKHYNAPCVIDVPQMWQGIKWSTAFALLCHPCDSRGWPWMSRTLIVAFLAHVVSYA
jgi:hypothetical protein